MSHEGLLLGRNVYVISSGPAANELLPRTELATRHWGDQEQRLEIKRKCQLQRYLLMPDNSFNKVFTRKINFTAVFSHCWRHPAEHSGFSMRLYGRVGAFYDLDEASSNDHILTLLQDPELGFELDYDPERRMGFIRQIGCRCDWPAQDGILPHLLTAINRDEVLSGLQIITREFRPRGTRTAQAERDAQTTAAQQAAEG